MTAIDLVHIAAIVLVGLAAALSVAHALELPGKMRLDRDTYLAVQRIYYPGFTIGGAAEPAGTVATAALLLLLPFGSVQFWLVTAAIAGMAAMMAVFWLVTQPVNKFWTEGLAMGSLGSGFFQAGGRGAQEADWTILRDRWERSHVMRAALSTFSFLCLLVSLAIQP